MKGFDDMKKIYEILSAMGVMTAVPAVSVTASAAHNARYSHFFFIFVIKIPP